MKMRSILAAGVCAATLFVAGQAPAAAAYPDKPIRFVIPFPPGGTSDTLGRLVADGLSKHLGQTVIVENRPGAGTAIGTDHVAKSAPDGYTLLLTSPGVAVNAAMRKNLPYDTERDIEQIVTLSELPMVVYASLDSKLETGKDLVAAAKKNPGTLAYGTAGNGSTGHLTMKLLEHANQIELVHSPFQGSAPSINAAVGNHVQLAADTAYLGKPMVDAGRLKGLMIMSEKRSPLLPDVPTAEEAGLPKQVSSAWFAIAVKRGTPADISAKVNDAAVKTLAEPNVRDALLKMGMDIIGDTPQQADARFHEELKKMAEAVRLSGLAEQ